MNFFATERLMRCRIFILISLVVMLVVMHHRQLINSEWGKVEECFEKKLSCWKAKYLSYGGRLVLLNSVLSSLPMFMMSCFGVLKNFDHFRSRFFLARNFGQA